MKKFSLLALAAAGLLFGACSEKDTEVVQESFNQYNLIEGQSAWVSVGIALPNDASFTRSNEDLNDGIEAEWKVYSAKLVLFKGASESEATLIKDYDLGATEWNNETGDQVPEGNTEGSSADGFGEVSQTSTKIVKEIESPALGGEDKLYGYVILNYDGNATNISFTPNTKFNEFKAQVLKAIGIENEAAGFGPINTSNHGLVMTNVPISATTGGSTASTGAVTTLAEINKNAIYDTKEKALAGTSTACIYVERAAVKVEVENKTTKIKLADNTELDFTFNGWALGNVNYGGTSGTGYYNTRQFDEKWLPYYNNNATASYLKYRMVGRTPFFSGTDHTTAFRTYFGRDVNFTNEPNTDNTFAATNLLNKKLTDSQYSIADKGVTYTYENTFDENSQIWANTTYVGVKVTISGGDFYTIEGQPNTKLGENDIPAEVAKNHSTTINTRNTAIQEAIQTNLTKATLTEGDLNYNKTDDNKIKEISYTLVPVVTLGTRDETDGTMPYTFTLKLENVKNKVGNNTEYTDMNSNDITVLENLLGTNLTAAIQGTTKLYKYVGGVTYYSVRIAHFGDVETPWSAPAEAYNNYGKIYPLNGVSSHVSPENPVTYSNSRASAWLGRWGIVRNNWYKLSIDKIEGLGSPVPEDYSGEIGGTPDDNPKPKYYIQAHIHILPWTVRKQSVQF